jgi:hypothetical protein
MSIPRKTSAALIAMAILSIPFAVSTHGDSSVPTNQPSVQQKHLVPPMRER